MASTINASNSGSGGLISTGDASGVLALQTGGTTAITIDASQNATFVGNLNTTAGKKYQVGSSTVSALAWVNYKGTSTQSIRASYNVSSVTYNSTGDYTVNFTTALSDANYCFTAGTTSPNTSGNVTRTVVVKGSDTGGATTKTTTAVAIQTGGTAGEVLIDMAEIYVVIFGN